MKKYTILKNSENGIMLVSAKGIYDVVHLNTSEDGAYIYHEDTGEFEFTEGFYQADYFEVYTDEKLVVRNDWAERWNANLLREKMISLDYEFEGEADSIGECDAEVELERCQDYPRQEATRLYHCDNGLVIREYCPFFADEQPTTFEVIKGNIGNI